MQKSPVLTARAKSMRRAPTAAEAAVWRILRAAPFNGWHFRRQVVFEDRFIADFASHRARLVIEVDGPTHDLDAAAERERTDLFAARGYRVVRVRNADALGNADGVARLLLNALAGAG